MSDQESAVSLGEDDVRSFAGRTGVVVTFGETMLRDTPADMQRPEQTRLIQQRQRARKTLAALMAQSEAEAVIQLHQHAQRLLRPLTVVNPYAERLTFLDDRTRTRRDHAKYLTLIESIEFPTAMKV